MSEGTTTPDKTDDKPSKSTSKRLTAEQKSTLKRLQDRPHKTILIPEDPLNPNDLVETVSINGVTYAIPRGKEFSVPDLIADVWQESYAKTLAARRRIVMQEDKKLVISS